MGSALRDAELRASPRGEPKARCEAPTPWGCLPADLDPSRPIPVDLTLPPLTLMQSVVARGIADGLSNAAIADRLCISPWTVTRHVSTIIVRLDVGAGRYRRVAIARWVWERLDGLRTDMPGPVQAPDNPTGSVQSTEPLARPVGRPGDPVRLDERQGRRAERTAGRPNGPGGRDWQPRGMLPLTMPAPGRPEAIKLLTPAEWAVLEGVMEGLADCEIAARLGVTAKTVKNHSWSIHRKVGVHGRSARFSLILWAYAYVPMLRRPFTPIAPLPFPEQRRREELTG